MRLSSILVRSAPPVLLLLAGALFGSFVLGFYTYATNHGRKNLICSISSQTSDGDSRLTAFTIIAPKDGVVTVFGISESSVRILLQSDPQTRLFAGKPFCIKNCRSTKEERVLIAVTQTPIAPSVDAILYSDLRANSNGKTQTSLADLLLYWILESHGHQWAAIAYID